MTPRIHTSEPTHRAPLSQWQRDRMGGVLPAGEGMSEGVQAAWVIFGFTVIAPAIVWLYWSFVR